MNKQRIIWPLSAFLLGSGLMTIIYFSIVSFAEGFDHALSFFVEDRLLIAPLILGFGIQAALYIVLKKQLYFPISNMGASGTMTGAGGTTSTFGMIACCAHHVTDVLPILGLSAAATFLAEYQTTFMFIGLGVTLIGILVMVRILIQARKNVLGQEADSQTSIKKTKFQPSTALTLSIGIIGVVIVAIVLRSFVGAGLKEDSSQSLQSPSSEVIANQDYPIVLESLPTNFELWFSGETKIDEQGAVLVEVTPLYINKQTNTLYFGVALNTHSVDLSMDLADLANLVLEGGEIIGAEFWDAPVGGHHVSGTLSFLLTDTQVSQLEEAVVMNIIITNLDAAERHFVWTRIE